MVNLKKYAARDICRIIGVPSVIALAAFVSMLIFSVEVTHQTEENTFSMLMDSAKQQVMLFDVSIEGQVNMLSTLADSIAKPVGEGRDLREFIPRLEVMKYSSNFTNVGITGKDGEGYISSGHHIDIADRGYFQKSMLFQTVVEKVKLGKVIKTPIFIISVPIVDNDRVVGILFGSYDFSQFKSIAKIDAFKGSSYCFIVDSDGDIVIGTDKRHFFTDGKLAEESLYSVNFLDELKNGTIDRRDSFDKFMNNFKSERGGMFGYSFGGTRRYAVYQPLGINGWVLFNMIDASSVDARKNKILYSAFVVIGIVALCSLFLVFCIYRLNAEKNRELRESEELYRVVENFTNMVIFDMSIKNDTIRYNENFEEMFGYKPRFFKFSELVENYAAIVYEDDLPMIDKMLNAIPVAECGSAEFRCISPFGYCIWMRIEYNKLHGEDGQVQRIVGRLTNIDDEKKKFQRLRLAAERDSLTGLLNRKTAEGQIRAALAGGGGGLHALFIIDVDDFKSINDGFGHIEGDRVLMAIAKAMEEFFRGSDIIGRLGGDEFVVLLKDIPSIDVLKTRAAGLRALFSKIGGSCSLPGHISASFGVSVASGGRKSFEELYREADEALYRAKAEGKNGYHIYGG